MCVYDEEVHITIHVLNIIGRSIEGATKKLTEKKIVDKDECVCVCLRLGLYVITTIDAPKTTFRNEFALLYSE